MSYDFNQAGWHEFKSNDNGVVVRVFDNGNSGEVLANFGCNDDVCRVSVLSRDDVIELVEMAQNVWSQMNPSGDE